MTFKHPYPKNGIGHHMVKRHKLLVSQLRKQQAKIKEAQREIRRKKENTPACLPYLRNPTSHSRVFQRGRIGGTASARMRTRAPPNPNEVYRRPTYSDMVRGMVIEIAETGMIILQFKIG